MSEIQLVDEVRTITGYDTDVLDNQEMLNVVRIAMNDLEAMAEKDVDFYSDPTSYENRALMWASCVFALMRLREMDGPDVRLEHIDIESVRAAGKENGEREVEWYRRANKFANLMSRANTTRRFGSTNIERGNRVYGGDDDTEDVSL